MIKLLLIHDFIENNLFSHNLFLVSMYSLDLDLCLQSLKYLLSEQLY